MKINEIDDFNIKLKQALVPFLFKPYTKNISREMIRAIINIQGGWNYGGGGENNNLPDFNAPPNAAFDVYIEKYGYDDKEHQFYINYYLNQDNLIWRKFILTFEHSLIEVDTGIETLKTL